MEAIVGRPVDSFAYPHGYHDRAVRKMVIDAGYTSAAAVRNALSHAQDDQFALARFTVMVTAPWSTLRKMSWLAGDRQGTPERWRTSAWRQVRRFRSRKAR